MTSSTIAWPRLTAGAAAIVLSILLALGIEEWREIRRVDCSATGHHRSRVGTLITRLVY